MSIADQLRIRAERAVARALLALPRAALVRLYGGRRIVVDGAPLDEQAQAVLATARMLGKKNVEQVSLERARKDMHDNILVLAPARREVARTTEHEVGPWKLRVYVPRSRAHVTDAPGLLYLHGGGFVCGDVDAYDPMCRHLADEARCVVASLEYRLAPEHKFPAAVEDACAAFTWLHGHARELGIDPDRIGVCGDSAGGNLSAVVAQQQKRTGGPLPKLQVLIYPATDMTRSLPSHKIFDKGFFLEGTSVDFFLDSYLNRPEEALDPRASPLHEPDLRGLPTAMVVIAGYDVLRDEGRAYADKLEAAGVRVIRREDTGMFHGYVGCSGVLAVAATALADITRVLRDEL